MKKTWHRLKDIKPQNEKVGTWFEIKKYIGPSKKTIYEIYTVYRDVRSEISLMDLDHSDQHYDNCYFLFSEWDEDDCENVSWRYITDKNEILSYQLMSL